MGLWDFGTLGFWTWHFLTTQKAEGKFLTIENAKSNFGLLTVASSWTFGLLGFGILDFETLGLWDWWTLGLLDFGTLGLWDFRISDLAFFDNSESQGQFFRQLRMPKTIFDF